jgi:ribose/xylose/arabinose/galactoside ABC-type transport system permease subunit
MIQAASSASRKSVITNARAADVILPILSRYGIYLFLAILIAGSGIASPAFLSSNNVSNMLVQVAPLGIVVIGQTFVILVRGLDLSVASIMATAAVSTTAFSGTNQSIPQVVMTALAIGLVTGFANGLLVTKRRVSPFLATLATMIVLQGFRFFWTQGAPSGNIPPFFRTLGAGTIAGIPFNLIIMAVAAIGFSILLHRAAFGRRVFIVGGNPVTARLVGIAAGRVTIVAYVISGVMAALAGLLLSGFVGVVDNFVGRGFELDSIVAAVIGGVALSGGRGTITGALAGAAILVVISNAVLMFGLPIQVQTIIKGVVIITAAAFYVRRTG